MQIFGLDDRGGTIGLRRAYYQDPVVAADRSATIAMADNDYVVGTFVASNATQNVVVQFPGNASGGDVNAGSTQGVVVWLTPPQVSLVVNPNGTVAVNWNQNLTDAQTGVGPAHLQSAPNVTGPWTDLRSHLSDDSPNIWPPVLSRSAASGTLASPVIVGEFRHERERQGILLCLSLSNYNQDHFNVCS